MYESNTLSLLLSIASVMVEKTLFLGQTFEIEILIDLHVLRPPESENHIFIGRSIYMSVIKNKQQQKHEIW